MTAPLVFAIAFLTSVLIVFAVSVKNPHVAWKTHFLTAEWLDDVPQVIFHLAAGAAIFFGFWTIVAAFVYG